VLGAPYLGERLRADLGSHLADLDPEELARVLVAGLTPEEFRPGRGVVFGLLDRHDFVIAPLPNLAEVNAALARLPANRIPSRRDWERLSSRWRADLDERIATLEALRDRLTTCIGCGCLSIDKCELLNPDDEAAEQGPGPHFLLEDQP